MALHTTSRTEPTPAPKACPFCYSAQVATSAKAATNDATYWRCHTCGQIWNPARLLEQSWRRR